MHSKLFQSLPSRSRGACSNLDFDLYDVHDKKLNTFGQVTLPIIYGETLLLQNFVISDGISEECILGWDAIRKHGFTIDGENQSIYLANEGSSQIKGAPTSAPEMSITSSRRVKIASQSVMVIEAKIKGSFPYVSPKSTFVFSPNSKLEGGLVIKDFVSTVSKDGVYNVIVENHSLHSVCLPRTSLLGTIEIASSLIGKVKIGNYNYSKDQLNNKAEIFLEKPDGKNDQEVPADYDKTDINSQWNGVAEFFLEKPEGRNDQEVSAEYNKSKVNSQ